MPFIRVDSEVYDEIVGEFDGKEVPEGLREKPSGEFEYESATAKFKPADFGRTAQWALTVLKEQGATGIRVQYDGGYDEGFAHAEAVLFGAREASIGTVSEQLAEAGFAERLRADPTLLERYVYVLKPDTPPAEVARIALDDLAHELASVLLGHGYGTGEYELYGAFAADFATSKLIDDPQATKPDTREW